MQSLLLLVLTISLIVCHELAHFLMARALGIPIKQFSIGVGPVVWRWQSEQSDGTKCDWEIHALPFSGFVKFETKYSPWKRALVYFAGPAINLLLAVVLVAVSVAVSGGNFHSVLMDLVSERGVRSREPILMAANFSKSLGLFNLLPLGGFDGAQCLALVLRGFLQRKTAKDKTVDLSKQISENVLKSHK
jgi:membrane-associated protease RseP (regulator of RpoE activity)